MPVSNWPVIHRAEMLSATGGLVVRELVHPGVQHQEFIEFHGGHLLLHLGADVPVERQDVTANEGVSEIGWTLDDSVGEPGNPPVLAFGSGSGA